MPAVLDASALLAHLGDEPGAELVADTIAAGASISAVNLAEVLATAAARGVDPVALARQLTASGLLGGALAVEDFITEDAVETARLRPVTRESGLSLGDRACLALARRRQAPAVTADAAWADLDLGVVVLVIS